MLQAGRSGLSACADCSGRRLSLYFLALLPLLQSLLRDLIHAAVELQSLIASAVSWAFASFGDGTLRVSTRASAQLIRTLVRLCPRHLSPLVAWRDMEPWAACRSCNIR